MRISERLYKPARPSVSLADGMSGSGSTLGAVCSGAAGEVSCSALPHVAFERAKSYIRVAEIEAKQILPSRELKQKELGYNGAAASPITRLELCRSIG